MKQLKYIMPVIALFLLVLMLGCNRADEPTAVSSIGYGQVTMTPIEVEVDIQPHHPTSRVNCKAKNRLIAVGIMTTPLFDAADVDHATVCFQGAYEAHIDPETGLPVRHLFDVDEDGDKDLILHFLYRKTDLHCESTQGCLWGETLDDVPIQGCDDINMFPK
ncbi:MAG: hypothetical protein JSU74_08260 [Candidatus Zixiibacteriota bacterium]|nr:MAG: hypothetical protein JSU74_08260 [candidate division Zixibacteria bacterium]